LDPKPVTLYPFILEVYVDYTVSYITGDAQTDAIFKRNGRIHISIEVINDNEIIWMSPGDFVSHSK